MKQIYALPGLSCSFASGRIQTNHTSIEVSGILNRIKVNVGVLQCMGGGGELQIYPTMTVYRK